MVGPARYAVRAPRRPASVTSWWPREAEATRGRSLPEASPAPLVVPAAEAEDEPAAEDRAVAAEGATVAVTHRTDLAGAERVADEIRTAGGSVVVARYDLAEPETAHALVQQLTSDHSRLDLLVANAVAWPRGSTAQPTDWRTSLRTNLEGTIATIDTALPHLLALQGRIVLISTTAATDGMPGATAYGAAKAGLHGLVSTPSVEHAPSGVLTNAVLPGLTLTDRARRLIPQAARDDVATRTPTRRLTDPTTSQARSPSSAPRPTDRSPANSSASTEDSDPHTPWRPGRIRAAGPMLGVGQRGCRPGCEGGYKKIGAPDAAVLNE